MSLPYHSIPPCSPRLVSFSVFIIDLEQLFEATATLSSDSVHPAPKRH